MHLPHLCGIDPFTFQQDPAKGRSDLHFNLINNCVFRLLKLNGQRRQSMSGNQSAHFISTAESPASIDRAHRHAIDFEHETKIRPDVRRGPNRHRLIARNIQIHLARVGRLMAATRLLQIT